MSLVRVYQLILLRLGMPDSAGRQSLIDRLDHEFPAHSAALNQELAATLIALDAPAAVPKTLQLLAVARVKIRRPYPVSFMPTGLLNGLNPEEVLDLLGYVLSGGDRGHPMFKAHSAGR